MIIKAYDIAPAKTKGTSVMRWTEGRKIEWLPVAREREAREVRNAAGKSKTVPSPPASKQYFANTYIDGTTYVDIDELKRVDIQTTASVLLHEGVHFTQYTTVGNMMTGAERQRDAHQAELNAAKYLFDPNNKDHQLFLGEIKDRRDANAMIAEHEKNAAEAEEKTTIGFVRRRFREVFPLRSRLLNPTRCRATNWTPSDAKQQEFRAKSKRPRKRGRGRNGEKAI